jgi:hypothetical protein
MSRSRDVFIVDDREDGGAFDAASLISFTRIPDIGHNSAKNAFRQYHNVQAAQNLRVRLCIGWLGGQTGSFAALDASKIPPVAEPREWTSLGRIECPRGVL